MLIDNRQIRTPIANKRLRHGRRAGLKWQDEKAIEALVSSKASRIAATL